MHWGQFDRTLYLLKLASLSGDLHRKTQDALRRVSFGQQRIGQGEGVGFYAKLVDAHLDVLGEHLEGIDRICREVWHVQGGILTPDFIRRLIRDDAVSTAIAARCGAIQGDIQLTAQRKGFRNLTPVLRLLARERKHLESNWFNRYEIEARELELREKRPIPRAPKTVISVPADGNLVEGGQAPILVGGPQDGPSRLLEDASPASSKADFSSISYPTFPTARLQQLLQETEDSMDYLKSKFPDWRAWGSGYGPGNTPPDYYVQIGRLEKDREQIILALSKRLDKETPVKSAAAASELTPRWDSAAQKIGGRTKAAPRDPDVAKRRTVVNRNDVSADEMCEIFDRQSVLLPLKWKRAGIESWRKAYRDPNYRRRIYVLISKDRASR